MKNLRKIKIWNWLLCLSLLAFIACDNTEDEVIVGAKPIAEAGPDQNSATGARVILDGSASTDADGDPLTYSWALTTVPGGSAATVNNNDQAIASFTPDEAGTYVATLTVNDGNNAAVSDNVTIEVIEETGEVIIVDQNITANTVWEDVFIDPSRADYRVTSSIGISADLLVEAGVVVEVVEDVFITVASGGSLVAEGTASNGITFTSDNVTGGIKWGGIKVASTSSLNKLEYTTVSHAGSTNITEFADFVDLQANIGLFGGGKLSIINSEISDSEGWGIYIRFGELVSFENNVFNNNLEYAVGLNADQATKIDTGTTFSDNEEGDVEIFGSTLSADGSWVNLAGDAAYTIWSSVDLGAELTIDAGARLEFREDVKLRVLSTGALIAQGTANDKITFTSKDATSGILWKGLEFASASALNELDHCIVEFAGNSEFGAFADFVDVEANIAMHSGAKLNINNTQISDGGGYGIYSRYGTFESFTNNVFADNALAHIGIEVDEAKKIDEATTFTNDTYAIEIYGGTVDEDATWVNLNADARYNITNQITVESGLVINPGVEIDLNEDIDIDVRGNGYFTAEGTTSDPILFTSSNEPGEIAWGGIKFYTSDARNKLDFVTINLAGGNGTTDLDGFIDVGASVAGNNNARLEMTNSTISNTDPSNKSNTDNGDGFGVYFQGIINDIESAGANNTFSNNPSGNVY